MGVKQLVELRGALKMCSKRRGTIFQIFYNF